MTFPLLEGLDFPAMMEISRHLFRCPGARGVLAWLLFAAFLAAPWQVSVAASAASSPEIAQTADAYDAQHAAPKSHDHDAGLSMAAGDVGCADDAGAAAHSVSCCKGICSLCPGLFGAEQRIRPPGRAARTRLSASRLTWRSLTPELLPQPPKSA